MAPYLPPPPPPPPKKISKSLANHTRDTVALGINKNLTKSVLPADKKVIFNMSAQTEETETINSNRDWEISGKTENISVRGRLKENSHFWKNESKLSLFVQNITDNDYIIPFTTIAPSFYASNNKSSLRNSRFVSQTISRLLENNCIEVLDQKSYCCNPLTVAESKKSNFHLCAQQQGLWCVFLRRTCITISNAELLGTNLR